MQLKFKDWTLALSWKWLVVQACFAVAMGKMICLWLLSAWPTFSWLAFAFWYSAMVWVILGCREYREASLSYFDGTAGEFKPRLSKQARAHILAFFVAVALAFTVVGILVQLNW